MQKSSALTGSSLFKIYPTVTALLRVALVFSGHGAELFMNKANVRFLCYMVWVLSTVAVKVEIGTPINKEIV